MSKHEFHNIAISLLRQDIIHKYNLLEKNFNSCLYVSVEEVMYGLVEAIILLHTAINKSFLPVVYEPAPITLGLFRHNRNIITFQLVVDSFGIKYKRK